MEDNGGGAGIISLHSYEAFAGIPLTITGGEKSPMVTVCVATVWLPDPSVAVQVLINW
jgi:hypothetical protein